jgi:general secretion pathway protein A
MYKEFYHMKENPFNVTADPDFFFSSVRHSEAFSHLIYGIQQRKGILVVTGEIGTGKTTLCRTLLDRLDKNIKTALILNPSFSDLQLLRFILKDLGIEGEFKNKFAIINALNEFLLKETSEGNNVALIIDESQNLSVRQLEQIRLLSNLETEKAKLLQIILVGQPELCKKLKLNSLRQLDQRISVRYHLKPLDQTELKDYIQHRLKVSHALMESSQNPIFVHDAIDAIFDYSKGTPRMVNILCDRALLAGYTLGTKQIDKPIIHRCIQEIS